jgi:hypothetical protein
MYSSGGDSLARIAIGLLCAAAIRIVDSEFSKSQDRSGVHRPLESSG